MALGVLLVSAMATLGAWWVVGRNVRANDQARFDARVKDSQELIVRRMETYIHTLRGAASMITMQGVPTPEQWRIYASGLEIRRLYPGIQGVGFSLRVRADDVAEHQARMRTGGRSGYAIRPGAARPEYHSIIMLEPLDWRNQRAIGYDMYTEAVRRDAMVRARDTGEPALSGRVTLVQETAVNQQAGFLIYFPVYLRSEPISTIEERRKALIGFTYSPFRADDLFAGIFGEEARPPIGFEIFDGTEVDRPALLHDHDPLYDGKRRVGGSSDEPAFSATRHVDIAGHPWTIVFTTQPAFHAYSSAWLPQIVLLFGLVVSGLLAGLTWVLATGRARAEQEVALRTWELKEANLRLQDADRYKDEFLSVMSHELRTPLNFITGFASVLGDGMAGPLNPTQQAHVGRILGGAERMLGIVEDLLDIARIQAGKVTMLPESGDYGTALADVVGAMQPLADRRGVSLSLIADIPGPVCFDRLRVSQVVTNLINNALKFTPPGGSVTVRAFAAPPGMMMTEVVDTGRGIPATDVEKVFEKFHQVDMSSTRESGGTGLGLAIARAPIEAHGGHIGVRSEPGRGSTFFYTLFLAGEEAAAGAPGDSGARSRETGRAQEQAAAMPRQRLEILVVEDELENRAAAEAILTGAGHSVTSAENGKEALELCANAAASGSQFDLIVLDVLMPIMDGLTATRHLRSMQATREIPILMLSARAGEADERLGLEAGADVYVKKPVSAQQLLDAVGVALQR